MALIKLEPELKVLIQPRDNIIHRDQHAVTVSDVLTQMVVPNAGSATQDGGDTATAWAQQSGFEYISPALEVVRFNNDGTATFGASVYEGSTGDAAQEMAGFFLKPTLRYKNNVINSEPSELDPVAANSFGNLQWKAQQGTAWKTYVPYQQPYRNFIRHGEQWPDKSISVKTVDALDKDKGFGAKIIWRGVALAQTQVAGYRLSLCDDLYSIEWRGGHPPRFCRKGTGANSNKWQVWKTFTDLGLSDFKGETDVAIYPLGGRLVVEIDNFAWWFTDSWGAEPTVFRLPKGKLTLSSFGVDAGVSVHLLDYYKSDGKAKLTGTLQRNININIRRNTSSATGYAKGYWVKNGRMTVSGEAAYDHVSYTATLTSSGTETPIISAALMDFPPSEAAAAEDPFDITAAIENTLDYESFEPGITDTAQISFKTSRVRLAQLDANWADYVKQFAPITVDVRWRYRDDVTCAISTDATFTRLFEGYIINPDMATLGTNDEPMTIVARDPVIRFMPPAAFIDGTYTPLDWLFLQNGGKALYGGDCIKYLIGRELGVDVGELLNGDGNALKYFSSHYPLMGSDNRAGYFIAIKPPTQAGFQLPPPFGQNMIDWFNQIRGYDQAVFYWGWTPDSPDGRPCFVYGRIPQILASLGATAIEIPDKEYNVGDSNVLFSDATVRFLSETTYNEVVVWGAQVNNGIMPSLFQARAQVSPSDPLSADNTWRRTKLFQADELQYYPDPNGLAAAMANFVISEFQGKVPRTVAIGIPQGDAFYHWGRKIKPKMVDKTLGIDGEEFRITKVQHKFDINRDTAALWGTTLTVRPLSNKGF